jgi:hypothetical protein
MGLAKNLILLKLALMLSINVKADSSNESMQTLYSCTFALNMGVTNIGNTPINSVLLAKPSKVIDEDKEKNTIKKLYSVYSLTSDGTLAIVSDNLLLSKEDFDPTGKPKVSENPKDKTVLLTINQDQKSNGDGGLTEIKYFPYSNEFSVKNDSLIGRKSPTNSLIIEASSKQSELLAILARQKPKVKINNNSFIEAKQYYDSAKHNSASSKKCVITTQALQKIKINPLQRDETKNQCDVYNREQWQQLKKQLDTLEERLKHLKKCQTLQSNEKEDKVTQGHIDYIKSKAKELNESLASDYFAITGFDRINDDTISMKPLVDSTSFYNSIMKCSK